MGAWAQYQMFVGLGDMSAARANYALWAEHAPIWARISWPLIAQVKRKIRRRLVRRDLLRWAAPVRTLRQVCGERPRRIRLSEARAILVIRPDEIGDVVLTSPFLRELRRAAPQARITLLVSHTCYNLVEHCPYVDAVHSLPFTGGLGALVAAWRLRWRSRLWRGVDLVLLPRYGPDFYQSILVGHLLAGRAAILVQSAAATSPSGSSPPVAVETFCNPLIGHEVIQTLRFLRWCGAVDCAGSDLEAWLTDRDREVADQVLPTARPLVAFATGARDPARCWPIHRFADVAEWLCERYGMSGVVLGSWEEFGFDGAVNLIGQTTLRQAVAVLAECDLLVGNDSGLKHLAAAAAVPVVEISAFRAHGDPDHPNSPSRFHAWNVPHRVVQPPAGIGVLAIDEVPTKAVQAACEELLLASRGSCAARSAADK